MPPVLEDDTVQWSPIFRGFTDVDGDRDEKEKEKEEKSWLN